MIKRAANCSSHGLDSAACGIQVVQGIKLIASGTSVSPNSTEMPIASATHMRHRPLATKTFNIPSEESARSRCIAAGKSLLADKP